MTLYGVIVNKDKEREKSGPTKNWCYSEFDIIGSDVIGSYNCTKESCHQISCSQASIQSIKYDINDKPKKQSKVGFGN